MIYKHAITFNHKEATHVELSDMYIQGVTKSCGRMLGALFRSKKNISITLKKIAVVKKLNHMLTKVGSNKTNIH